MKHHHRAALGLLLGAITLSAGRLARAQEPPSPSGLPGWSPDLKTLGVGAAPHHVGAGEGLGSMSSIRGQGYLRAPLDTGAMPWLGTGSRWTPIFGAGAFEMPSFGSNPH